MRSARRFYVYSTATLERHYEVLAKSFSGLDALICFAVKANSNQAVLATLARLGAGMDVVSEGELRRALAAGVPANKIIFAGVGKTKAEMAFAIEEGILGFNVESEPELHALSEVAIALGTTAKIAIRVNPDVDAKTHAKISTGKAENKFGVPYADARALYAEAAATAGHQGVGHSHAHRFADYGFAAVPRCVQFAARTGYRFEERRHRARTSRHRRRARRAVSWRELRRAAASR